MRAPAVLLALVSLLTVSTGVAQVTASEAMPAGWETLSAGEFLTAAQPFVAEATLSERAEVDLHAWTHFFRDQEFVANGDLKTLLSMVDLFGRYRPEGVTLADVEALHAEIAKRFDHDSSELSGLGLYEIMDIASSLKGSEVTDDQNIRTYVQWMKVNDWRSLETKHLYNLFGFVNADSINRRKFSARWTGTLTAPRAGEYILRQARVYRGDDCDLKVWINGKLILDSMGGKEGSAAFSSSPVVLVGNKSATFRAELVHEADKIVYSASAPMALVTWKNEGGGYQIIPADAFSPPEGTLLAEPIGLLGEYFGDTDFSDLRASRIDPTLDMVWTWPPAAPTEAEASGEVFSVIVDRLLDDEYLTRIASEDDGVVAVEFERNLWRVAYRMTATQRLELVSVLTRNPAVLARLSPESIGRLYRALYMLPGDTHLDLIGEWALARPQPRCQPGWYPGWGNKGYQKLNTDFYWAIGHMMQGPYESDAERLCDAYLIRPDGECCLPVAYASAFAGHNRSYRSQVLNRIKKQLSDDSLSGDQKVSWLVAHAFIEGVAPVGGPPRPLRGMSSLEEAIMLADSVPYQFWALQEMVARKASCGQCDAAIALTDRYRSRFTDSKTSEEMNRWVSLAKEIEARCEKRQQDEFEEASRSYQNEINRRSKKKEFQES